MQVYDPTSRRQIPVERVEVLGEYGGWHPARAKDGDECGEWFALRIATNESLPLKKVPASVRESLKAAVERWDLQERLVERCTAASLSTPPMDETDSEAVLQRAVAEGSQFQGRDFDLQVAILAARRAGFPAHVIAYALETLNDEPDAEELLDGVEVLTVSEMRDGNEPRK